MSSLVWRMRVTTSSQSLLESLLCFAPAWSIPFALLNAFLRIATVYGPRRTCVENANCFASANVLTNVPAAALLDASETSKETLTILYLGSTCEAKLLPLVEVGAKRSTFSIIDTANRAKLADLITERLPWFTLRTKSSCFR